MDPLVKCLEASVYICFAASPLAASSLLVPVMEVAFTDCADTGPWISGGCQCELCRSGRLGPFVNQGLEFCGRAVCRVGGMTRGNL